MSMNDHRMTIECQPLCSSVFQSTVPGKGVPFFLQRLRSSGAFDLRNKYELRAYFKQWGEVVGGHQSMDVELLRSTTTNDKQQTTKHSKLITVPI
jgi:hypothetical protein